MQAGILIKSIDGKSAWGMPLPYVATLLMGPAGSTVDLVLDARPQQEDNVKKAKAENKVNSVQPPQSMSLPQRVRLTRQKMGLLAHGAASSVQPWRGAEEQLLGSDAIEKLRRDPEAFYLNAAPAKACRVPMLVDEFVSRGATQEELQYLNHDLSQSYGMDLSTLTSTTSCSILHSAAIDYNVRGRLFSIPARSIDHVPGTLLSRVRAEGRPCDEQGRLPIDRHPSLAFLQHGYIEGYLNVPSAALQGGIQEASEDGPADLTLTLEGQLHQ